MSLWSSKAELATGFVIKCGTLLKFEVFFKEKDTTSLGTVKSRVLTRVTDYFFGFLGVLIYETWFKTRGGYIKELRFWKLKLGQDFSLLGNKQAYVYFFFSYPEYGTYQYDLTFIYHVFFLTHVPIVNPYLYIVDLN